MRWEKIGDSLCPTSVKKWKVLRIARSAKNFDQKCTDMHSMPSRGSSVGARNPIGDISNFSILPSHRVGIEDLLSYSSWSKRSGFTKIIRLKTKLLCCHLKCAYCFNNEIQPVSIYFIITGSDASFKMFFLFINVFTVWSTLKVFTIVHNLWYLLSETRVR